MTVQPHPLRHLAIIMDGNGRWAKERGLDSISGHEQGVECIRTVLDCLQQYQIETLTVFAFSSENWDRPAKEVRALMSLFAAYLKKEAHRLAKSDVRLRIIGNRTRFSTRLQKLIADAEQVTRNGKRTLVLAVDYGGRWDIVNTAKKLASKAKEGLLDPETITEQMFQEHICLGDLPMPDLCIRTAGEHRISNFLLWQLAYCELYFADCYWPDFDALQLEKAVGDYYRRQRRFGLKAEQTPESRSLGA